jgi:tetratricopeptide (TPR) repeat protein
MRLPSLSLLLLALCLSSTAPLAISQEQNRIDQVRDLLRQASKLIADIPEAQRMSAASNIANTQARAGDLAGALTTAHLLKKPQELAQALGSIAYAIDYAGDLHGALELINSSPDSQTKESSYASIAQAHANKGDFSDALRTAHLIKNDSRSLVAALDGIATAQWKIGDHDGAQRTWGEAFDLTEHARMVDPFMGAYLVGIATSRAKVGETAAASAALNDFYRIIEEHDPPDQGLLSSLALGFAQIDDVTSALRVIKELLPGSNRDSCVMNVSAQLAKKDDVADATEIVSRISDPQIQAIALNEIAISQASFGRPASAIETTDKISSPSARAGALASLALDQAEKGDAAATDTLRRASSLADDASGTVPLNVFETIAVTRAMLGDFAAAQADVQKLPPEARAWPWGNITSMMVEAGDLHGALDIATNEASAQPKASALLGTAMALLHQIHAEAEDHSASH